MLTIICACACAVSSLGCRSLPQKGTPPKLISANAKNRIGLIDEAAPPLRTSSESPVAQVAFQQTQDESDNDQESDQADLIATEIVNDPAAVHTDLPVSSDGTVAGTVLLVDLEQQLLSSHPEILEAQSKVNALGGKQLQAGLAPNPTVGIATEDINANDGAGRYGIYFGRQVVRGGKLELAQSVVQSEIEVAQNRLDEVAQRLLIELRRRYYNALLAVETVRQTNELTEILQQSVVVSERLFEAEEIAKAPVLRSQVEFQRAQLMVRQAENQQTAALRQLASLLGQSEISPDCLAGDVKDVAFLGDFETLFDRMLENHPSLTVALADVERSRRELSRQNAVAIPNVTWQTTLLYDFTTDETVGAFQIGLPLPTSNRNQGGILQAQQNIQTSIHAADKKVLQLRDVLTNAWTNYVDARIQLEALDNELLPKAEEALELASEGYRQAETDFLELLSAQQLFAKTRLGYLNTLRQRWQYQVEIEGLVSGCCVEANGLQ